MDNKICQQCNSPLEEGTKFCAQCGAKVPVEEVVSEAPVAEENKEQKAPTEDTPLETQTPPQDGPVPNQGYVPQPQYVYMQPNMVEQPPNPQGEYAPVSTLGFFGIFLLLSIPMIGPILTIIWACGGCRKINKRNYCRAILLQAVIVFVLSVVLVALFGELVFTLIEELTNGFYY